MKFHTSILLLFCGAALSACAVSGTGPGARRSSQTNFNGGENIGSDPIVIAPTPTPTPTSTSTPVTGTEPVYSIKVAQTGYVSVSYQIPVNKILKVRFTPGEQDSFVAGTRFSPTYSKLAVYVTVGSRVQPTALLSNGLASDVQSSSIMDFSTAFTKTCASTDTACRQYVTVTVSKPNNDYFCYNYGTYCTHAQMYSTHPWNGVLEIQTDDTVALQ